ncbi:MAG: hypothetical protein EOP02_15150 [Proteobacteria bacterium]|nr:MAG: hypothetical protein EOP02_15150 [Pseudomonadota bacterium]
MGKAKGLLKIGAFAAIGGLTGGLFTAGAFSMVGASAGIMIGGTLFAQPQAQGRELCAGSQSQQERRGFSADHLRR